MNQHRNLLRIATAGSVDDGKSTLIGRLLYDTKSLPMDHIAAVQRPGGTLDLAALSDGLRAEREQGITIDVAYRFFSSPHRSYILADTPGHEAYTRNMFTGASTADVAIVLVDATKGVTQQTKRHTAIASLLEVKHLVAAVNKIDLVDYSQERYAEISRSLTELAAALHTSIAIIPIAAKDGDNVVERSSNTNWYQGPTLFEYLESLQPAQQHHNDTLISIQGVIKTSGDSRNYMGYMHAGACAVGDTVVTLPTRETTTLTSIDNFSDTGYAQAGQSITLQIAHDLDLSRGAVIANPDTDAHPTSTMEATLCWFHTEPALLNHRYNLKLGSQNAKCVITQFNYEFDLETLKHIEQPGDVRVNAIATVTIEILGSIVATTYHDNRFIGSFILIDEHTHNTAAAGLIMTAHESTTNSWSAPQTIVTCNPDETASHPKEFQEFKNRLNHSSRPYYELNLADLHDEAIALGVHPGALAAVIAPRIAQAGIIVLTDAPIDQATHTWSPELTAL